jgi:RNA polymerase subunit RPABC4/transcription elongation factor Spt4
LSLIGGIFLLLGGLLESFIFVFFGVGAVIFVLSLVVSVLVIVGAVMLYVKPEQKLIWGIIILVFSILGFIFNFIGGFVVGSVLGIIGGALGLAHKPEVARSCPRCGRAVASDHNACPYCGYVFPVAYGAMPSWGSYPTAPEGTSSQGAASAVRTCPKCGASVTPGARFCANCGSSF